MGGGGSHGLHRRHRSRNNDSGSLKSMTFQTLCIVEPRLADLAKEVEKIRDDGLEPSFCANDVWYGHSARDGGIKERLCCLVGEEASLVGEEARNPSLRTSRAYDVAYEKLYAMLPECRNCRCKRSSARVASSNVPQLAFSARNSNR